MQEEGSSLARGGRVKSVVLVVCALMLFLAGLLLLLAPAAALDHSRSGQPGSPLGADGWIMSAQSSEPVSLPGG